MSLNPSPRKLKHIIVKKMKNPGRSIQGADVKILKFPTETESIFPQLGYGSCIPSPIKLKALSPRIYPGIERVMAVIV